MPIYVYESPRGKQIEREFPIGEAPAKIGHYRKIIAGVSLCVPKEHRAVTYAGREGDKVIARHHRQNREVAEGLANGTMRPADDRDVCGDKQPREFKAKFNEMYQTAKDK